MQSIKRSPLAGRMRAAAGAVLASTSIVALLVACGGGGGDAGGTLAAQSFASGPITVSTRRARCSAPHAGKLHQTSPQPCAPLSSVIRISRALREVSVRQELRTGLAMGASRTKVLISRIRMGAAASTEERLKGMFRNKRVG